MTDLELKREASSLMLQLLACLTSSDNGNLVGITEGGAIAIGEALRRVRDVATAAERQRCAAVCRDHALLTSGHWAPDVLRDVAAEIERQEGE